MSVNSAISVTKITISIAVILINLQLSSGYVRGNDWKDLLLTSSEKYTLDKFKENVVEKLPEDFMKTDFFLIRWLRSRNFNMQAAQNMLFEAVRWRKKNNISDILMNENFDDVKYDFPLTVQGHGYDKQQRPVATIEMGEWDLRSAVLQGRMQRVARYMEALQESVLQKILEAQSNGKNVTRGTVLVDIEGFNLRQHFCTQCISIFLRLTSEMEAYYPGFWEEIIVINAPPGSRVGLEAVRPAMSQQTREILKLFDGNKSIWMNYLDERIDRDQRTSAYGGTMKPSSQ